MGIFHDLRGSSRTAIMVAVAAATVGIIYGYDSSNIGGALDFIAKDFHITSEADKGLLVSYVIFGEIAGALSGGWLANRFGRKRIMVLVAGTFALFSLLSALAWSVPSLAIARILLGVTVGISIVVVPMFVAESSPTKIRGALLVLYQVATVFGIICGYLVAWALAPTGNWRIMLGAAAIPGILITLALMRAPDTPRWYMMKGRREDAAKVLARIDPDADVHAELDSMEADHAEAEADRAKGTSTFKQMVSKPYLRATVFVVLLGFAVQITGINAIVYYSPQIIKAMGFSEQDTMAIFGLPALIQFIGLIAVFVSMAVVDRMGRRPVLLTGIGIMIAASLVLIFTFGVGAAGQTDPTNIHLSGVFVALGFLGLVMFTVGFTFGFGALVWVYAGETFPSHLRGAGSSTMLTSDLVANYIVGVAFLPLLKVLGGGGVFAVLGGFAVLAFLFVWKFAPETKGRPLDDIRIFWENGGKWPSDYDPTHGGTAVPEPRGPVGGH
ncbi:sugar porter family MFS transporter [Microbacterium candidum]|uniref:Sugar porter family MFS transporter n=1 Tax=Microbacterium candidum TaxID=3041922 RepID=A0ABT7N329_9MICO|nr:sugar porter family MFS transporter [Microbacterium sp. ASV49]MDL9981112.1 sugar porter family MFS transporter [Microbacterium sp. ASV49]